MKEQGGVRLLQRWGVAWWRWGRGRGGMLTRVCARVQVLGCVQQHQGIGPCRHAVVRFPQLQLPVTRMMEDSPPRCEDRCNPPFSRTMRNQGCVLAAPTSPSPPVGRCGGRAPPLAAWTCTRHTCGAPQSHAWPLFPRDSAQPAVEAPTARSAVQWRQMHNTT